jgi:hypothetical protein
MADLLLKKLNSSGIPQLAHELIDVIKLYTGEACWRNGKFLKINRIPKTDSRYYMLKKRPQIKQVTTDCSNRFTDKKQGMVWFKINGSFMVITCGNRHVWIDQNHAYYDGHVRETYFDKTKLIELVR